ncbi:MAG: extracellular solute-binding protein, partial [Oscillospiraceae bacterium]|nr:extracellular solute-binding protein [Oscillospiraceae bacterium]
DFGRSQVGDAGYLYAICDQDVMVFAPDGSLQARIGGDRWPNAIVKLRDGSIAVTAWDDAGMHQALFPVDLEKKSLGASVKIPDAAWSPLAGDENFDFYYQNGMYLYGYSIEREEEAKILNWLDVDVNGDSVQGIRVQPDGTVTGVVNTWKNDTTNTEIIKVYKVPYDQVPHKETLTMAVMYTYEILDKVIDFNRHSDSVRIQLIDYSEYNDYENGDYEAGRTKLLTEVMSGSMPDLVALSQLPYSQMAAKGLLEDLYPFIDSDPEIKRSDYFPNALKAMEKNGKLCMVTTSFNVQTLIGARSVVGDEPGWTYKELQAALATMPEGCEPMDMYTTRGDILQTLLYADLDHYVDWSSGKCSFDSPDFIELLQFAAQFPESIPDDQEWESAETRIAQGRQMLTSSYLYSVDSILWNDPMFGEEGCTYIGYPTNNGVGSVMVMENGYGMSASCKNKAAAWQFLRTFLLDDAQEQAWNIPLSLKAYRAKLEQAMTPEYEKDENGNFVLDENGEKIQLSRGGFWRDNGTMVEIYAMTQEQADRLWEAVTTCTKVMNMDTAIYEIVNEQAQAFFAGQKTAEEVARLIQSKANIYVNEQR